jgi:hypothetical protein
MSFLRKQESRVPGENRDPVFEMVPDACPGPNPGFVGTTPELRLPDLGLPGKASPE